MSDPPSRCGRPHEVSCFSENRDQHRGGEHSRIRVLATRMVGGDNCRAGWYPIDGAMSKQWFGSDHNSTIGEQTPRCVEPNSTERDDDVHAWQCSGLRNKV